MSVTIAGKLSDDICRCHDRTCKDAPICARYVQFGSGRVHAQSLRGDAVECASLILDRSTP